MSKISDARSEANRANAALSTGPRSEEGKNRSSRNAVRHGLTGRVVVLPGEDMERYFALTKEMVASLDPQTPLERQLAQTIADQQWRLNRIRSIEDALLGLGDSEEAEDGDAGGGEMECALRAGRAFRDQSQAFVNLSIYEQRIHRIQKEAIRQLQEMQGARVAAERTRLDRALRVYKLHKMEGLPYEPEDDGFVYSSAELEEESGRRDIQALSVIAKSVNYNRSRFHELMGKPQEPKTPEAA